MTTIKDVAREAGVSVGTAAAALRGEDSVRPSTAQKVLAAATAIGYTRNAAARFLKRGNSNIIALLVPDLLHPYFAQIAAAVSRAAQGRELRVIVQESSYEALSAKDSLRRMTTLPCDGMIINLNSSNASDLKDIIGELPTVLLNYKDEPPLFDSVITDRGNTDVAFGYLTGRGYQHAAVIGAHQPSSSPIDHNWTGRDTGVEEVLRSLVSSGLGDESDCFPCDWRAEGGFQTAQNLVAQPELLARYDVFYCMNDLVATGFIRGLHEAGIRVPDDKAVFGHDGMGQNARYSVPQLSTLEVGYGELAERAVELLIERIRRKPADGPLSPRRITIPCRLVRGETA